MFLWLVWMSVDVTDTLPVLSAWNFLSIQLIIMPSTYILLHSIAKLFFFYLYFTWVSFGTFYSHSLFAVNFIPHCSIFRSCYVGATVFQILVWNSAITVVILKCYYTCNFLEFMCFHFLCYFCSLHWTKTHCKWR